MNVADQEIMKIGDVIESARKEAGLTRAELAERAEVSRPYISQLERDLKSPTLAVFSRICGALNVLPSKMLARAEKRQ